MKQPDNFTATSLCSNSFPFAPGAHPSLLTLRHPHLSCHHTHCPPDFIYSDGPRRNDEPAFHAADSYGWILKT